MMTRIVAVAFLVLAAVPAPASDASFDQRGLVSAAQPKGAPQQAAVGACACHRG